MLALAFYELYLAVENSTIFAAGGVYMPSPRAVRMTVLGLRDPTFPAADSNPFTFGLLQSGCLCAPLATAVNGSTLLSFDVPQAGASGYQLSFAADEAGTGGRDPVRWMVEAVSNSSSKSDARGWRLIGASQWRSVGSQATYYPSLEYPTPMTVGNGIRDREVLVVVDGRPRFAWVLSYVGVYVVAFLGWTACVVTGHFRWQGSTLLTVVCLYSSNAALFLAAALSELVSENDWRCGAECFIWFGIEVVTAGMLWWDESRALVILLLYGAFNLVAQVQRGVDQRCTDSDMYTAFETC